MEGYNPKSHADNNRQQKEQEKRSYRLPSAVHLSGPDMSTSSTKPQDQPTMLSVVSRALEPQSCCGEIGSSTPSALQLLQSPALVRMLQTGAFVPPERVNVTPSLDITAKPFNFGTVIPGGIYRSSYPQHHDYPFLKSLNLKTIVTLVDKELPETYKPFLHSEGIVHYIFKMKGTKKEEIPLQTMRDILAIVLDPAQHPLLIHCNHGKHRTGCVVGIIRKLSGWSLGSIHDEYDSYAEPKIRDTDRDYIANFELDSIVKSLCKPLMVRAPTPVRSRTYFYFLASSLVILFYTIFWCPFGEKPHHYF